MTGAFRLFCSSLTQYFLEAEDGRRPAQAAGRRLLTAYCPLPSASEFLQHVAVGVVIEGDERFRTASSVPIPVPIPVLLAIRFRLSKLPAYDARLTECPRRRGPAYNRLAIDARPS